MKAGAPVVTIAGVTDGNPLAEALGSKNTLSGTVTLADGSPLAMRPIALTLSEVSASSVAPVFDATQPSGTTYVDGQNVKVTADISGKFSVVVNQKVPTGTNASDITPGQYMIHANGATDATTHASTAGLNSDVVNLAFQNSTVSKVTAVDNQGTLTPGNSTPLTDGASAVLLGSEEWARERNLPVLAYITFSEVAAVDFFNKKEGLLMAPAYAVPRMLARAGITLQDFDSYEIHEAFAAQVLCTLKAWEDPKYCKEKLGLEAPLGKIDRSKLNVNGSSLAAGHPFAATGGRIVASLAKMLAQKGSGRGLISICAAGGQGVVAILER